MSAASKDSYGWLGLICAAAHLLSPLLRPDLPAYGILSGIAILALLCGLICPVIAAFRSSKWWLLVTAAVVANALWFSHIHRAP